MAFNFREPPLFADSDEIIGLSGDGEWVGQGYDSSVRASELTQTQRRELAAEMIKRWTAFAEAGG